MTEKVERRKEKVEGFRARPHGLLSPLEFSPAGKKLRPEGFEPATLGSEDYCATGATINDPNELRQTSDAVVPVLVPTASEPANAPDFPPDLARVVANWDQLPDAIKTAILALVRAAGGRDA